MGGGDLSAERIGRKEDERVFGCADLGRGDVIKARHSVGTGNRGLGLNQGWGVPTSRRGDNKRSQEGTDRGVKTRTMKGFESFRGRDRCGTARCCGDKGEI